MEMASALAVLVRTALKADFRRIDPASARIVLVDMAPEGFDSVFGGSLAAAQDDGSRSWVLRYGSGTVWIGLTQTGLW